MQSLNLKVDWCSGLIFIYCTMAKKLFTQVGRFHVLTSLQSDLNWLKIWNTKYSFASIPPPPNQNLVEAPCTSVWVSLHDLFTSGHCNFSPYHLYSSSSPVRLHGDSESTVFFKSSHKFPIGLRSGRHSRILICWYDAILCTTTHNCRWCRLSPPGQEFHGGHDGHGRLVSSVCL